MVSGTNRSIVHCSFPVPYTHALLCHRVPAKMGFNLPINASLLVPANILKINPIPSPVAIVQLLNKTHWAECTNYYGKLLMQCFVVQQNILQQTITKILRDFLNCD